MSKLEIGDRIFGRGHYGGLGIWTVERVTKTRAFTGGATFDIYYRSSDYLETYPRQTGYNTTRYSIATKDDAKEIATAKLRMRIAEVDWSREPVSVIEKVLAILDSRGGK